MGKHLLHNTTEWWEYIKCKKRESILNITTRLLSIVRSWDRRRLKKEVSTFFAVVSWKELFPLLFFVIYTQ